MFKLGIIINPLSGIGGSVALKGSDGSEVVAKAFSLGAKPWAQERMQQALSVLLPYKKQLHLYGFSGDMGQASVEALGFHFEAISHANHPSTYRDTMVAARLLQDASVDLILFAGGDGTARNIFDAVGNACPVLGVPTGVKMHSGVYAITPSGAGKIIEHLLQGQGMPISEREVRDIDEAAFRAGYVQTQYYGELLVPEEAQWLQSVKNSGVEVEELTQIDVAATFIEEMSDETLYFIGPGSTTHILLQELNLEGTLLGVDALKNGKLLASDLTSTDIQTLCNEHNGLINIVITAIGGQGHIFGRGNQQFTPEIIEKVGRAGIQIVATKEKIQALEGRPLLLDTNSAALDENLSGYYTVITGFNEKILYPVGIID